MNAVLFDVGDPIVTIPPPEMPPEKPNQEEPDRTKIMEFEPPLAGATISACGKYRYVLWRKFRNHGKKILWILTNPSKADSVVDDPTVSRCISISKRENASEIYICNPFAYRATDPKDVREAAKSGVDIVGPKNLDHIYVAMERSDLCIVGWGANGEFMDSGRKMMEFIDKNKPGRLPVRCLGITKYGHPRHPLYVSKNAPLVPFMYDNSFIHDEGFDF